MSTLTRPADKTAPATPEGWLDGFINEDGSQMTADEFDAMWENRTPPSDLAEQVAAGEWGPMLQAHYALRSHLDVACALLLS
jgi:hypothetical protein